MSKKLILLNSFGPMGSTLLSGLIEKIGFGNFPLRKICLSQYVMGELPLESGVMQDKVRERLVSHSQAIRSGGVSVLQRDSAFVDGLTDIASVEGKLSEYRNTEFDTLQDLYFTGRNIYAEAVKYKNVNTNPDWHIELTVDIHRFCPEEIYEAYNKHFDEVYMIHLTRDFKGWINSLSSQAMAHPNWKQKFMFFPHLRYADYALYNRSIKQMSGLHIDFKELFDGEIEELAEKIANFLNVPLPDVDFRKEKYDLYGKICAYETAFVPFDDNVSFMPQKTLSFFNKAAERKAFSKTHIKLLSWIRYVLGMCSYPIRSRKK